MTMTAGSAVVAEDSPPAFGNLHAYDDAIVPWIRRMTDEVHEHGAACMIQLTHLGRRTGWAQDDWLPVVAPSPLREPAHRAIPKEAEDWDIDRIVGKYADAAERMQAGGHGRHRDRGLRPPVRPVLVAADQPAHRRVRRLVRATGCASAGACSRAIRERVGPDFIVGIRMAVDETRAGRHRRRRPGWRSCAGWRPTRLIDFVNVIRGYIANERRADRGHPDPRHAVGAAPRLRRRGARGDRRWPCSTRRKVDDVATARHAIREGKVDLVGMTRAHLADPHIVRKIARGSGGRDPARASGRPTASTASTRPARRCASTTRRPSREADDAPRHPPRRRRRDGSWSSAPGRAGWRRPASRASGGTT